MEWPLVATVAKAKAVEAETRAATVVHLPPAAVAAAWAGAGAAEPRAATVRVGAEAPRETRAGAWEPAASAEREALPDREEELQEPEARAPAAVAAEAAREREATREREAARALEGEAVPAAVVPTAGGTVAPKRSARKRRRPGAALARATVQPAMSASAWCVPA